MPAKIAYEDRPMCMVPECPRHADGSRGLCNSHYGAANALVKKGKVTWEALVDAGKCLPYAGVIPEGQLGNRNTWFLDGVVPATSPIAAPETTPELEAQAPETPPTPEPVSQAPETPPTPEPEPESVVVARHSAPAEPRRDGYPGEPDELIQQIHDATGNENMRDVLDEIKTEYKEMRVKRSKRQTVQRVVVED